MSLWLCKAMFASTCNTVRLCDNMWSCDCESLWLCVTWLSEAWWHDWMFEFCVPKVKWNSVNNTCVSVTEWTHLWLVTYETVTQGNRFSVAMRGDVTVAWQNWHHVWMGVLGALGCHSLSCPDTYLLPYTMVFHGSLLPTGWSSSSSNCHPGLSLSALLFPWLLYHLRPATHRSLPRQTTLFPLECVIPGCRGPLTPPRPNLLTPGWPSSPPGPKTEVGLGTPWWRKRDNAERPHFPEFFCLVS